MNRRRRRRSQHQGFTLMEMLVVLAIVLILAGITAPALIGPSAARSVEVSARQVATGLEEARLLAQRERVRTRLLIPTSEQPAFGNQPGLRSYALVSRVPDDTNAWVLRSGWRRLQSGTAVDPAQGVVFARAGVTNSVTLTGGTHADLIAPYVEFLPNGSTSLNPSDPAELIVVADAVLDGAGHFRARNTNLAARVEIDPISGAVLVR